MRNWRDVGSTSANAIQRLTLRSNNKALAQALESRKQELKDAQTVICDLRQEVHQLLEKCATLERVAGLKDDEIDREVQLRILKEMATIKAILADSSSHFLHGCDKLGQAIDRCNNRLTSKQQPAPKTPYLSPDRDADTSLSPEPPTVSERVVPREKIATAAVSDMSIITEVSFGDTEGSAQEMTSPLETVPEALEEWGDERSSGTGRVINAHRLQPLRSTPAPDASASISAGVGDKSTSGVRNFASVGLKSTDNRDAVTKRRATMVINKRPVAEETDVGDALLSDDVDVACDLESIPDRNNKSSSSCKDVSRGRGGSDGTKISAVEGSHSRVEVHLTKPGQLVFAAGRKNSSGIRADVPTKLPVRARTKGKKNKASDSEKRSPSGLASVFDFHDKTPSATKEAASKDAGSVFDLTVSESLCVERETLNEFIWNTKKDNRKVGDEKGRIAMNTTFTAGDASDEEENGTLLKVVGDEKPQLMDVHSDDVADNVERRVGVDRNHRADAVVEVARGDDESTDKDRDVVSDFPWDHNVAKAGTQICKGSRLTEVIEKPLTRRSNTDSELPLIVVDNVKVSVSSTDKHGSRKRARTKTRKTRLAAGNSKETVGDNAESGAVCDGVVVGNEKDVGTDSDIMKNALGNPRLSVCLDSSLRKFGESFSSPVVDLNGIASNLGEYSGSERTDESAGGKVVVKPGWAKTIDATSAGERDTGGKENDLKVLGDARGLGRDAKMDKRSRSKTRLSENANLANRRGRSATRDEGDGKNGAWDGGAKTAVDDGNTDVTTADKPIKKRARTTAYLAKPELTIELAEQTVPSGTDESTSRRPARNKSKTLSYKEPSLHVKMRRTDN